MLQLQSSSVAAVVIYGSTSPLIPEQMEAFRCDLPKQIWPQVNPRVHHVSPHLGFFGPLAFSRRTTCWAALPLPCARQPACTPSHIGCAPPHNVLNMTRVKNMRLSGNKTSFGRERFLSLCVNPASQLRTFNKVIAILLNHGLLNPPQTVSKRWCIRKRSCIASFELRLHLEILLTRFHPLRRKHMLVYQCSSCELMTSSRKYWFWCVSRGRRPSLFACDDKRDKVTKMASVFDLWVVFSGLLWRSYHFPFAFWFFS